MRIKRDNGRVVNRSEKAFNAGKEQCPYCSSSVVRSIGNIDFDEDGWFRPITLTCSNAECGKVSKERLLLTGASTRIG